MSLDPLTFGLAGAGYLTLAKDVALRLAGRRWPWLGVLTAVIVAVHVALVWIDRFDGSLTFAWEKSPPGFVIFHTAFALILLLPWLRGTVRDRVTWIAFAIVCAGALPAPFRYDEVAVLAVPLWLAFAGVLAVWWGARRTRAQSAESNA